MQATGKSSGRPLGRRRGRRCGSRTAADAMPGPMSNQTGRVLLVGAMVDRIHSW